jgi:hypothetical protein
MKKIAKADFDYSVLGQDRVVVTYVDGTKEVFTSQEKLTEVQNQLKNQQKQILMEGEV